jgi:hypothetical protein
MGVLLTLATQAAWREEKLMHWLLGQYISPTLGTAK